MYKSRLQELCQQKLWSLPNYTVIKDGLDHNPRFKASVLINGVSFDTPDFCRSSKEAQNEAARLAFHHFTSPDPHLSTENPVKKSSSSSSSPSPVSSTGSTELSQQNQELKKKSTKDGDVLGNKDGSSNASAELNSNSAGQGALSQQNQELQKRSPNNGDISVIKDDIQSLHKNLLQNYAQRRNLSLPVYSCVREGPPHAVRFKANVTVDEQTFEGPEFCRTLKEAEHAAARVALTSLSHDGIQEDDTGFYKNLLQDFLRKEGLSLPTYKTNSSGSSHLPIFTSTVEIGDDVFQGIAAKTKKQAEMNAAKVAYSCLKERGLYRNPPSLFQSSQAEEALQYTSSTPHSTFNVDLQQNIKPGESLVLTSSVKSGERRKERKGSNEEDNSSKTIVDVGQFSTRSSMPSFPKPGINSSPKNKESDMIYARLRDPFPSPPSSPDDNEPSSPTTVSQFYNPSSFTTNVNTELPPETKSSLLCNRVRVYPRKPDMVFPKGITVMPISDDKWVAVSLDFPSEEDETDTQSDNDSTVIDEMLKKKKSEDDEVEESNETGYLSEELQRRLNYATTISATIKYKDTLVIHHRARRRRERFRRSRDIVVLMPRIHFCYNGTWGPHEDELMIGDDILTKKKIAHSKRIVNLSLLKVETLVT